MRKNLLRNIFFAFITFILSAYLFIYWWFHNSIDRVLSVDQQKWLLTEIKNSPELPSNIYLTLEKYYPDLYSTNSWDYKIKTLFGKQNPKCQCMEIYLPYVPGDTADNRWQHNWVPFDQYDLIVKLFIEKHFTQKECLRFNLNISDFGQNTRNIKEAAKHYYNKKLDALTEVEIVSLYIIQKAPALYNPYRKPNLLYPAVKSVMNK